MSDRPLVLIFMLLVIPAAGRAAGPGPGSPLGRFAAAVSRDYRHYYTTPSNLLDLGMVLGGAGVLANTHADRWFTDRWQSDTRSGFTDDLARPFNKAGHGVALALPALYLGALWAGGYTGHPATDAPVATWGARSLRAFILGAPQQQLLTHALGSGRPTEGNSHWHPFQDSNAVSGHAFYGAIPFLTAARMAHSAPARYGLYAASALPAFARINADKHYLSQVVLGWSLAYLATGTVADVDAGSTRGGELTPAAFSGGALGVAWHRRF